MTRWPALAARATAASALLAIAPACGSDPERSFELGNGAFPWSAVTITVLGELARVTDPPTSPPPEWSREFSVDECQLLGVVYGIGWPMPCEGSASARVEACAPDPELGDVDRCHVTLDSVALVLRPDFDEPVIDAARVELASPVATDESWDWLGLASPRSNVMGTLTITGRDGGAPTRYELDYFELRLDYLSSSTYFLELRAAKPGW